MNKIGVYFFIIILYLGLTRGVGPNTMHSIFIPSEAVFGNYFNESPPFTLVLVDAFSSGLFIKSYYHKYRLVGPFRPMDEVVVRVSSAFYQKNILNIGMSLFRRYDNNEENTVPLPPGTVFFLNKAYYGGWRWEDSGEKVWRFSRVYRFLNKQLGIQSFSPTYDFYKQLEHHQVSGKPYYGLRSEFGSNGRISQNNFPSFFTRKRDESSFFKSVLNKDFKLAVIKKRKLEKKQWKSFLLHE